MFTVRKWLGLAALTTLGGLIITSSPSGPGGDDRVLTALWLLLVPLAITIGGLAGEAYWSRWLAPPPYRASSCSRPPCSSC
ncbi:MAG: hypothetical protein P8Y21_07870 [Gemmatimonadales bacterium]